MSNLIVIMVMLFNNKINVFFFQEICGDPEMFVGGASRFDVKQGELGTCVYDAWRLPSKNKTFIITFVQYWSNVNDVGRMVYNCYANVLCMLHCVRQNYIHVDVIYLTCLTCLTCLTISLT